MDIQRHKLYSFIGCCLLLLWGGQASSAADELVVVVPARHRMIKLGFDVAALRGATLISYQGYEDQDPVLHIWNSDTRQWQPLSIDAYTFGQFSEVQPDRLYLIGTEHDVSPVLLTGAAQAKDIVRILSLNPADVMNKLDETLSFSTKEWRALSERHGLQIEDKNWARRKWGRYGPPKEKSPSVPDATEPVDVVEPENVDQPSGEDPAVSDDESSPAQLPAAEPDSEADAAPAVAKIIPDLGEEPAPDAVSVGDEVDADPSSAGDKPAVSPLEGGESEDGGADDPAEMLPEEK